MKNLVILGTARNESNTLAAISELCPVKHYELVDLRLLEIAPYNYESEYSETDDFLTVAKRMQQADNIVFATPVYWYSMSASLKNFFDRLSDLLSIHKNIGRSLKGKSTFLISTGSAPEMPPNFEDPFRLTSEYFEMQFKGSKYKSVN